MKAKKKKKKSCKSLIFLKFSACPEQPLLKFTFDLLDTQFEN